LAPAEAAGEMKSLKEQLLVVLRLCVAGEDRRRPSVVGKPTSTIWIADIFSITARAVSPGANRAIAAAA